MSDVSEDEREAGDGWGGEPVTDVRSAFEEANPFPRQITLTLRAPPLTLPGDRRAVSPVPSLPPASSASHELPHCDGWTVDRLERASMPPAQRGTITAPPPALRSAADPAHASGATEDDAFALVARASAAPPPLDLVSEMAERFALGDFSGSLRAAELLLGGEPEHAVASHYASESRDKLERLFTSRLDAHGRVLVVHVPESEIRWLGLDPQVSTLLSRIDGTSDYETVVAASGVPRLTALRALVELVEAKVVRLV